MIVVIFLEASAQFQILLSAMPLEKKGRANDDEFKILFELCV